MSYLVLDELQTSLEQDFELKHDLYVYCIRPNLYFHNDPAGSFTIGIYSGADLLVSKSLSITEILSGTNWAANQYHYGVINFQFDTETFLKRKTTYTIKLSATSYSFSEGSYLGWIKDFEHNRNTFLETVDSDYKNPFDFELWARRNKRF